MKCIYCGYETRVTNSRHQKKANNTWRRRQCLNCSAIFTSVEKADLEKSIVVSKNNALKPFLRDRLFASVYDSLKHRKTALSDATALTDTVVSQVLLQAKNGTIEISVIKSLCGQTLARFDKTAAVYYAAYHPEVSRL